MHERTKEHSLDSKVRESLQAAHTNIQTHTDGHIPFLALGSSPPVVTPAVGGAPLHCHGALRPAEGDTSI